MTAAAPPAAEGRWPVERCSEPRCGARIIFAVSEQGNRMPVDADPAPRGTIALYDRGGQMPLGIVLRGAQAFGRTDLRKSHFATCANPERFRRRRT